MPIDKLPRDFDQIAYRKTIEELRNDEMFKFVKKVLEKFQGEMVMEKYIALTKSSKNIVFTGAPGTGKTFFALEIAKKIVDENNAASNIKFVQFHPSYDYTDFVEGLYEKRRERNVRVLLLNACVVQMSYPKQS